MFRVPVLIILAVLGCQAQAQTLLYPGDIALVNLNADGDKNFDVLLLRDIEAGTVIYFTDDAWIDSCQQFRGSEGFLEYTAARDLPAGSVVSCPGKDGGNGFAKLSGSFNPSGSGDNIIVYQGSKEDPFFLYGVGWARGSTVWEYAESSASYRSDKPPGLSLSESTIASLGTDDNYRYKTSSATTGTLNELLVSIADPANWDSDNATPFTPVTQSFTITVSPFHFITTTNPADVPARSPVVITTAITLSNSLTCQSLAIASGGSVEILPDVTLKVYGMITNEAGAEGLVIRSDGTGSGAIIHSVSGVQGTVHRYIGPGQWHFVSSPVSDPGAVDELLGTTGDGLYGIYCYDETGGAWVSAAGTAMDPGRGYNVCYTGEGRTVIFRGTLNDCRLRSWIQVTRGSGSGWNLVGNPFPCSLSWGAADQADAPGWKNQATTLDNKTIWITTGGSGEGTTFVTFNGSSGVGVPDNSTGIIAAGQAFWVRAAADGQIGVGGYAKSGEHGAFKTMRRGDGETLRLGDQETRREEENGRTGEREIGSKKRLPLFHLSTLSPPEKDQETKRLGDYETGRLGEGVYRFILRALSTGLSDQVAVVIDPRAESGLDRFDSEKKIGTGPIPQLYIPVQNIPLVINAIPAPEITSARPTDSLPLTLVLPEPGEYEISITLSLLHSITQNLGVSFSFILEDRLTGARQALSDGQSYAFSAGAGILEGRFILIVSGKEEVIEWKSDRVIEDNFVVVLIGNYLKLIAKDQMDQPANIRLYDSQGKLITLLNAKPQERDWLIEKPTSNSIYFIQIQGVDFNLCFKLFLQ